MGNITALHGLCTSAGVAIAPGTVLAPGDGQKFYALTGGKKSGKWVIKYDKGDEAALLARPCHVTALSGGSVRSVLLVGQGANAGTMNASPAVVRMPADTFLDTVTDGSEMIVENPSGHPMAMLHLDTETVAWASATGTVSLGYEQEADEPVEMQNTSIEVKTGTAPLWVHHMKV